MKTDIKKTNKPKCGHEYVSFVLLYKTEHATRQSRALVQGKGLRPSLQSASLSNSHAGIRDFQRLRHRYLRPESFQCYDRA